MSAGSPDAVLYVVDSLGLSGKTRHLVSLVTRLDRSRFVPIVCRLNAEPSPLVPQLETADVPVHTIDCAAGIRPATALRLARLAWLVKATILHCYNPRPMLYGGLAARAVGIRGTVGSLSAFACHVPDRPYGFLPQSLATVSRLNVYRNRLAIALMRSVVAVSATLGQRFCEYNRAGAWKLHVIPYGADVRSADRITPEQRSALRHQFGFRSEDVVIGSVGRLVEQKDYPTQLRAFALAVTQVPNLRMVIAGDGPLRPTLERIARELAIADRVQFLGTWNEVPALLRAVDIFVLASKFEPFGVALLEAKAAGLPIVATAVNEIPEIITAGESGLLTAPEDALSMASLFVRLAQDGGCRARLGARARLDAERHSLDAAVQAYETLYDASLDREARSAPARPRRPWSIA